MIRILVLMAALCGIVYLGLYAVHHDTNYIVIGFGEWVVRTSLTVFLSVLFVLFVPAYLIFRALFALWRSPRSLRGWHLGRRYRSAQTILEDGLLALAEGHWKTAESQLVSAGEKGADAIVSHVFAARAAHNLGAYDRRDEYLNRAAISQPKFSLAVTLSQAQMQLESEQREQALASLMTLRAESPSHAEALRMLHELYEELGDWDSLLDLLPALKTYRAYDSDELEEIEGLCYYGKLVRAEDATKESLEALWESIPSNNRLAADLVEVYVDTQIKAGRGAACEAVLLKSINHEWSESLVEMYGRVEADAASQLKRAESWLSAHSSSAALHLTLGRLCTRNRLWGKARSFLEESIALKPTPQAYLVMSNLLEELDEAGDESARTGLRLCLGLDGDKGLGGSSLARLESDTDGPGAAESRV